MSIQLPISEVREEIRCLRDAASDLLDPSAHRVLSDFERSLQNIDQVRPGQTMDWQLHRESPLKTNVSKGEFCFDRKRGAHNCFAKITSIWTIAPVKPPQKNKRITAFQVCGKASVHIELFDETGMESEHALGSWRMELGDDSAGVLLSRTNPGRERACHPSFSPLLGCTTAPLLPLHAYGGY